ncbi:MAG: glycolate oxidase [Thermonema sp.]|uniref:(Fe-S)-binding protein n=1 Tax=Thermonema sp. TaxID=2231181 RepID=UPI0021DBE96D|nr:(Fe-S)-binding protein [Thermonema sp.]GIV38590.1 MAG: glycolate oxidase [Thermonema sp.]
MRVSVDLFIPCFVDQIAPEIGFSMIKILEKLGCSVSYNPNQTCCGQPAFNAGFFDEACKVAQKFVSDFRQALESEQHYIVAPSASCVGMVRNQYERLLGDALSKEHLFAIEHKVFELCEFIVDVLEVDKIPGAYYKAKAVYHDSCSALRECMIYDAPRKLLAGVEGLELHEPAHPNECCGFGGTFSAKFPAIAAGMAMQKVEDALAQGAELIISSDFSCLLHLDGYIKKHQKAVDTAHIADILASGW